MAIDQELERQLRDLVAKKEIEEILMRYCRGVDRGDRDLIASCYHPGGIDDHGDFVVASEDAAPLFVDLLEGIKHGGMHFVGNVLIELDGETAITESYFMAIHDIDRDSGRHLRTRGGRYVDRFERRDGTWGIVERVLADEWNQINAIQELAGGPEKYRFGTRDHSDPVFAIREGRVARDATIDPDTIRKRRIF